MTSQGKNDDENKASLNILIADDNPRIRQVIGWILESRAHTRVDCHLVMVISGKKVMEALENDHFDLILIDLQIPEMNGFEITSQIRAMERETGEHVPILAMAGFHLENGRQKCISAGMDDYLEKPFKIEELFETIERLTHTKI